MMLALLAIALQLGSSSGRALQIQQYNQLAREAAESGATYAVSCLRSNGMNAPWTGRTLRPDTDCTGNTSSGYHAYVLKFNNIQTRFVVESLAPSGAENQRVTVVGFTDILRPDGSTFKTYATTITANTGAQTRTNTVTFGYRGVGGGPDRVFFATIDSVGKVRSVGSNKFGQLGNGGTAEYRDAPTQFILPTKAVAAYANFLSVGSSLFVKDERGDLYGAGANDEGAIGVGRRDDVIATPQRVILPPGVDVLGVATGRTTFVLGSDHSLYAMGSCQQGLLGTGDYDSTKGCHHAYTPKRVALPHPHYSRLNTLPTAKIVQDRSNAYVMMQGGAVYGWGANDYGQLSTLAVESSSTPLRIGNFGDPGQPKAIDIAFNGDTLYIVSDDGKAYGIGMATRGETGTKAVQIAFAYDRKGMCFDDYGMRHSKLHLYRCNGTAAQDFTFADDGTIRVGGVCVDNTTYNKVDLGLYPCHGAAPQQFRVLNSLGSNAFGVIELTGTNRCITRKARRPTSLYLDTCDPRNRDQLLFMFTHRLSDLAIPGSVVQASTDEMFVSLRTAQGQVYSVGSNLLGAFGNSSAGQQTRNQSPVRFDLPTGVRAIDLWSTAQSSEVNNLFVVGDNGRVYGAGSNASGQLGDGTTTPRNTATQMQIFGVSPNNPKAKTVQSGGETTVVFTRDNRVWTVGANHFGQLGTGDRFNRSVPVLGQFTNVPTREYLSF